MTEKILHEIRFIETEEGFRLEVNGDKEKLREMGFGPGMFGIGQRMGFGGRHHGPRGPRRRHGFRHGHGHGPNFGSWWGCKEAQFEGEEDIVEKSPEDIK